MKPFKPSSTFDLTVPAFKKYGDSKKQNIEKLLDIENLNINNETNKQSIKIWYVYFKGILNP